MGTVIVRLLQLGFVGMLLAGMFMLGIFVFMLTAAVLAILGAVYWLRARGILTTPNDSTTTIHETHVYGDGVQEHVTIIETEFKEVSESEPSSKDTPRIES